MSSRSNHHSHLKRLARVAMAERGLVPDFPPAARAQADVLRAPAPIDASLPDLRPMRWCSIDNDDSRDLDQLSVAAEEPAGTRILVAIADVDALVADGSAIDEHARRNTTSVYTPALVFPMLPEKLSTGLTSLNEDEDRVAIVVSMLVTRYGEVRDGRIFRAAVRNRAQLAYDAVTAWLDGVGAKPERVARSDELAANLRLQDEAAQALRRRRHAQGALDLETIEPRAVFDGETVVDLSVERHGRARQLIEEFMVASNGVVARFLEERGAPSFRRIVRSPERWDRIVSVASEHGWDLPPAPDSAALGEFLAAQRRRDPVRFPDLSLVVIKLLGSGEYAAQRPGGEDVGHFALAVREYTHSTAPNRRYPDLITQRIVKAVLAGDPLPYGIQQLASLAAHCTEREDEATRVERRLRKSAAAMLVSSRTGDVFDGVVTGASPKGTWARVFHPPIEGKVVRGEFGLDIGQKVRVRLIGTDVDRGFIDFARA